MDKSIRFISCLLSSNKRMPYTQLTLNHSRPPTFIIQEHPERVHTGDQGIDAQVPLQASQQQRVVHVGLQIMRKRACISSQAYSTHYKKEQPKPDVLCSFPSSLKTTAIPASVCPGAMHVFNTSCGPAHLRHAVGDVHALQARHVLYQADAPAHGAPAGLKDPGGQGRRRVCGAGSGLRACLQERRVKASCEPRPSYHPCCCYCWLPSVSLVCTGLLRMNWTPSLSTLLRFSAAMRSSSWSGSTMDCG